MNRVIIKQHDGESVLVDTDSVVAIKKNFLVEIYDLNGIVDGVGCDVYLAGGTILEVAIGFSDLVAALFGADLVDDDDSYIDFDPDLNTKAEA